MSPTSPYDLRREQDASLPLRASVTTLRTGSDVALTVSTRRRIREPVETTRARGSEAIRFAGSIESDELGERVEGLLYRRWTGRTTLALTLPPSYLHLTPGDVIECVLDDGYAADYLIESTAIGLEWQIRILAAQHTAGQLPAGHESDATALRVAVHLGSPVFRDIPRIMLDPLPTAIRFGSPVGLIRAGAQDLATGIHLGRPVARLASATPLTTAIILNLTHTVSATTLRTDIILGRPKSLVLATPLPVATTFGRPVPISKATELRVDIDLGSPSGLEIIYSDTLPTSRFYVAGIVLVWGGFGQDPMELAQLPVEMIDGGEDGYVVTIHLDYRTSGFHQIQLASAAGGTGSVAGPSFSADFLANGTIEFASQDASFTLRAASITDSTEPYRWLNNNLTDDELTALRNFMDNPTDPITITLTL